MKIWFQSLLIILSLNFASSPAIAGAADWIGRVNYAGFSVRSHCTGTLISQNLVLTAAHCLVSGRTGKTFEPKNVIFRAGYHLGESKADVNGRDLIFMKGYFDANSKQQKAALDAAIIVLDRKLEIEPGKLSALKRDDDAFQFMGYSLRKPHILTTSKDCSRKSWHAKLVLVTCSAVHGQSGSPVISTSNNKIVGMVIGINSDNEAVILNLAQLKHLEPYLLENMTPSQ